VNDIERAVKALESALPWVATAMAHRPGSHPRAIVNNAEDLAAQSEDVGEAEEDEDAVIKAFESGGIFLGMTEDGDLGAWLNPVDETSQAFATSEFGLRDLLDRIESRFLRHPTKEDHDE